MDKKLFARYVVRETLELVMMGLALSWSAGRLDWWAAWALFTVMAAWIIATAAVILRFNPGLLVERLGPRKGAKPWDMTIMSILGLAQLARYILAGLDQRYAWTGNFPVTAQAIALILCVLGYALFVWATASNAFFSQVVRIQTERGHTVVTSGPYQYVRHPGYAGAIVFELACPILLASWIAVIPSVLGAILLIIRSALEDRTLQTELTGYTEYARRVRNRLLPGVW